MSSSEEMKVAEKRVGGQVVGLEIVVVKRDSRREGFDVSKLARSVILALRSAGIDAEEAEHVIEGVYGDVVERCGNKQVCEISSRDLADLVEKRFMILGVRDQRFFEAAKRYALARIYQDLYGDKWDGSFDERDLLLTYQAIKVLEARYLLKDPETLRYIESPQMLFRRVARVIASVERQYGKSEKEVRELEERFYEVMSGLRFIPNTPTLMNAGTKLGILSACFVLPVRDSLVTPDGEGIMDAVRAQAIIHKMGGGTGFSFSELRPEGDTVASTAGVASGPLSFMRLFDVNTEVIKQGGKRRGANMGILHVWHPDIERFIVSKTGELRDVHLQNFNISVGIYDSFMKALERGEKFPLINPRKTQLRPGSGDSRYYAIARARFSIEEEWVQEVIIDELEERGGSVPLDESRVITWEEALAIAEREGAIVRWIDPRELWKKIVRGAWDSGDPGLVFIDTINRRHTAWYVGKINATNPCAEEPLLDWEPCNLGSLDLAKYIVVREDGSTDIDLDLLVRDIEIAIRFLDNVIDAAKWPLPQLERGAKLTRKVGLGVMGWAHALIRLGIRYDSVDAIYLAWYLARFIYYHALRASIELAKEKGAFTAFNPKLYRAAWEFSKPVEDLLREAGIEGKPSEKVSKLISKLNVDPRSLESDIFEYGVRNAQVLSIAPTGTISIIAGTSSSIEPIFALAFVRAVAVGTFIELDRVFLEYLRKYELDSPEVVEAVAETGSIDHNPFMPRTLRELFRTAHDVSPVYHVLHQAAWQQWVDAGVSKTINMASEASEEDVDHVYKLAWRLGIKGITVYRDKSKSKQVIYFGLKTVEMQKSARKEENIQTQQAQQTQQQQASQMKERLRIPRFTVEGYTDPSCTTCEL
ncbi:ribonucleoside-diphosphate reductase, adenosylcobalamin-dependent [Desulfurococcaceae archaeon AG1]|jgi:ribonucleoside-diphosphate reductase alpha chain|nr:ribonucleoside-diphosphate reductase, adenosylcobalamin-dependent [Desulfurococcaceae archaeon AG1]